MFQVFLQERWASAGMLLAMILSILSRIIIWIIYQNMIKETDNMSATSNKVLKQCKLKFANCYQLNQGVANVPVFVDKFLNKLSLGPFSLQTLYHLSGQLMLLAVFFAGVGVCRSIIAGRPLRDLLPFYIVSFLGLYAYFAVASMTDIKEKRRVLKTSLVDYLENHMVNKLCGVERDMAIVAPEGAGQLGAAMVAPEGADQGDSSKGPGAGQSRSLRKGLAQESRSKAEGRLVQEEKGQGISAREESMLKEYVRENSAREDFTQELELLLKEFLA